MNEVVETINDYIKLISEITKNNSNEFKNDYIQMNYFEDEIRKYEIINNEIQLKSKGNKFIELGFININQSYIIYKYQDIYYLIIMYNDDNQSQIVMSVFNKKKEINKYIN